jgi:primosomal protein N' (replication factor Y)
VLILDVLLEYGSQSLDRTFSYLYDGNKKVGPRFRVLLDFNGRPAMGLILKIQETSLSPHELEVQNGYPFKFVKDIIDEEPLLTDSLYSLAKEVSDYYLSPLMSVIQAMLPLSLSPKLSSLHGPKVAYEKWVETISSTEDGLTDKQIEMLRLITKNGPILKKEAGSPSILQKLIEAQRVKISLKEKNRFVIPLEEREQAHEMAIEQRKAYDDILSSPKGVVLLEGVTGSGKTEVYLRLSEKVLAEGKSVLMLVPEINLTPAMVEYFSRRFGNKVAILHSELTQGERYDEYRRIARGEASIVVGARSAVFAPLSNLGLIILDEEHVESYKQDNAPYYHAREVAIMRGKLEMAKVLLGSATPSLESKARAMRGVYGYASLPHRINEKALPKTTIVDLTNRSNFSKESQKLSKPLLDKISEKLSRHEQIILLINRRGYWTNIMCPNCGHIFTCPSCGGNLTYHTEDEMLKCHHCGYVERFPKCCPECGNTHLMRTGYGTERVEKELNDLFPSAKVARLDSDVGKISKNLEKIIHDFHDGKYDILVGTQMIAKGHDFPRVTLSGVVLADIGLSLPTYRAAERTFELIAQAVGRSGRSSLAGEAIIQTYNPSHYAISYGAKQDYEGFFAKEMQERKIAQYPPYVYLYLLEFSGKNEEKTVQASYDFKKELESQGFEGVKFVGPLAPFYSLVNGRYKRIILIKYKNRELLAPYLLSVIHRYSGRGGIDVSINVDPLDY